MAEWKALAHELPPPDAKKVLVVVDAGRLSQRAGYVDAVFSSIVRAEFEAAREQGYWCMYTYWMPLPDPPHSAGGSDG